MRHTSENDSVNGYTAGTSGLPRSESPCTDGKPGAYVWPARLLPVYWPTTAEPLLIVALRPRSGAGPHTAPVASLPQLRQFGLWHDGDIVLPAIPDILVRRNGTGLNLCTGGESWGSCSSAAGLQWSTTASCLVGVATGISHLRGRRAAEMFADRLYQQQAVMTIATVAGPPFTVHISQLGISTDQR